MINSVKNSQYYYSKEVSNVNPAVLSDIKVKLKLNSTGLSINNIFSMNSNAILKNNLGNSQLNLVVGV